MKRRIAWPPVIERAAAIVRSYHTADTLRQVFYRLVSEQAIPNTENAYKTLSRLTARARPRRSFNRRPHLAVNQPEDRTAQR